LHAPTLLTASLLALEQLQPALQPLLTVLHPLLLSAGVTQAAVVVVLVVAGLLSPFQKLLPLVFSTRGPLGLALPCTVGFDRLACCVQYSEAIRATGDDDQAAWPSLSALLLATLVPTALELLLVAGAAVFKGGMPGGDALLLLLSICDHCRRAILFGAASTGGTGAVALAAGSGGPAAGASGGRLLLVRQKEGAASAGCSSPLSRLRR